MLKHQIFLFSFKFCLLTKLSRQKYFFQYFEYLWQNAFMQKIQEIFWAVLEKNVSDTCTDKWGQFYGTHFHRVRDPKTWTTDTHLEGILVIKMLLLSHCLKIFLKKKIWKYCKKCKTLDNVKHYIDTSLNLQQVNYFSDFFLC